MNKNRLLLYGSSHGAINHARIRMGLSGLNQHRKKYHFITQSNCPLCGHRSEDAIHYFFNCPNYDALRKELCKGITSVLAPNVNPDLLTPNSAQDFKEYLQVILYGSEQACYNDNCKIFDYVHQFITESHRFM